MQVAARQHVSNLQELPHLELEWQKAPAVALVLAGDRVKPFSHSLWQNWYELLEDADWQRYCALCAPVWQVWPPGPCSRRLVCCPVKAQHDTAWIRRCDGVPVSDARQRP